VADIRSSHTVPFDERDFSIHQEVEQLATRQEELARALGMVNNYELFKQFLLVENNPTAQNFAVFQQFHQIQAQSVALSGQDTSGAVQPTKSVTSPGADNHFAVPPSSPAVSPITPPTPHEPKQSEWTMVTPENRKPKDNNPFSPLADADEGADEEISVARALLESLGFNITPAPSVPDSKPAPVPAPVSATLPTAGPVSDDDASMSKKERIKHYSKTLTITVPETTLENT
jgi:hypothetical protein